MNRKVPPPPQHQVFINFRGDELRKNFISHLVEALQRNEINFFTDKQEKKGEDLSNLFKRIEESKIALAVFSKRYTESGWCLDELVKIKERADLGKLKVLPIFYNVTTDNVKYLTGEFGSNLARHQSLHEQTKIGKWKKALACISCKLGCPFIDNNGFSSSTEREFIDSIVKNVLEMLQDIPSAQTSKSVTNKPVERGEVSSKTTSSKKALTVTKGNPASPSINSKSLKPSKEVRLCYGSGFPVRHGRGDSSSMN
ncbi:Disease resistance protein [Hirschfeldia incana]|nr:Disease resistance protein [Hirschfeldia incana]